MKELAIIYHRNFEPYEGEHKEALFIVRNINQAESIFRFFREVQRFLKKDESIQNIHDLDFQLITVKKNTDNLSFLRLSNSDWNYSYSCEGYIDTSDQKIMLDVEKERADFLKNYPDGCADIIEKEILNSLTREQIEYMAKCAFGLEKSNFQLIKKAIKDFKNGEFFKHHNQFKYQDFFDKYIHL